MVFMVVDRLQRTRVKILGSRSIVCETRDCNEPADFLFRTGNGPIAGYCEVHAKEQAAQLRIGLPELPLKRLRAGF